MPKGKVHTISIEEAKNRAGLTVDEFSYLVGVSKIQTYRNIKRGVLDSINLGHRIIIPRTVFAPMLGVES